MGRTLLLLAVTLMACPPLPAPGPVPHDADAEPAPLPPEPVLDDAGDACTQPGAFDICRIAGENLCHMGCTAAGVPLWKTPKGTPYAEACRRAVADGRDTMAKGGSRSRCLAGLTTCPTSETCR